ncbi:hypothetical protein [Winogradskyella algicola]|uniref:hypothetical protein n=1 Tax=Winogradskyella algicola TaxID=2575815 RepID=UPI0011090896|nr:hypothetical protein [Winogradskyella algicola]
MKNKFLIPILLLGLLTLYFACQKDDAITLEQSSKQKIPKIETVSYDQVNQTFNRLVSDLHIENYLQLPHDSHLQGRNTLDTLGIKIDTDVIKQVTLDDYTS